jgi:signal transduction histidine kinase
MKWRWLVAVVTLTCGVAATVLLNSREGANPIFIIRASLSVLVAAAALLLAFLVLLAGMFAQRRVAWQRAIGTARREAADDRRRFLQRLDHELKNPLTAIRAALANFGDAPTAAARREALASVEAQTLRLSRLTADLRKIAELETRELEVKTLDLAELLRDVVAVAGERPDAHCRHLSLSLPQAPWPLPAVPGDADLLFLAFYNLVENALKYSGEEETVEIRAREAGPAVVIDVADTGPGIATSDLPRVWDELYRGEGARTVAGSGLGLALVRAVVERHGGVVRVESRAGHGTVFNVRLPVA